MGFLVVIVILRRNICGILFSMGLMDYPLSLILFMCSLYPWRGGFSNFNCPGRDLRDGPGSILQIGMSYIVAWDCGWHGVELHPLWL